MNRSYIGLGIVATVLALMLMVANVHAQYVEYKSFVLNSNRYAVISGSISFVVTSDRGDVNVGSTSITVGKGWTVILENIDDNTSSEFKIWIGSDGWTDIRNLYVQRLIVKNENGVAVHDFSNVVVSIKNTAVDISSIYSTLTIYVPPSNPSWTQFTFNDTTIINGNSGDEIKIVGVRPSNSISLNIDGNNNKIYAEGVAETAYVNGSEVPEIGLFPMLAIALFTLIALLFNKMRLVVSGFGRTAR
ncbi:MAG: hypothetical protein QW348_06785 [Ignisphaera sp.]